MSRSRADIIRHTRKTAQSMRSKSRTYRRMDRWTESDIGLVSEQHVIYLKKDWSFDPDKVVTKRLFDSVGEALRGINLTYPVKAINEEGTAVKEVKILKNHIRRLKTELKNTKLDMDDLVEQKQNHESIVDCFKQIAADTQKESKKSEKKIKKDYELVIKKMSIENSNLKEKISRSDMREGLSLKLHNAIQRRNNNTKGGVW